MPKAKKLQIFSPNLSIAINLATQFSDEIDSLSKEENIFQPNLHWLKDMNGKFVCYYEDRNHSAAPGTHSAIHLQHLSSSELARDYNIYKMQRMHMAALLDPCQLVY